MKNVKYSIFLLSLFALLLFMACENPATSQKEVSTDPSPSQEITENQSPNFVIIFTDDQGYGDLGCYGGEGFKTPHIDKMAAEGAFFTDFYVAASVCTPSRGALLTGAYPKRLGLHEKVIFPFSKTGLNPTEQTIPEILKPKGYTSACIGKWHLGHYPEFMPNSQGFDYFYGVPYSNDMDRYLYKDPPFQSPPLAIYDNTNKIAEGTNQDSLTIRWTNAATSFIKKNKDKPFFLYLAHNMPHLPWHVSDAFRGSSEKGLYGDIMQELDWSVGEVLNTLKQNGIDKNTMVIFTSDNGPVTRKKNGGSAGPLRGAKATTWEGGMRVPCIIRWPEGIAAGTKVTQLTTAMDLLPTIASLAGSTEKPAHTIDGFDISELLRAPNNNNTPSPYDAFYYYGRNGDLEAIREGDWKLHRMKYNHPTKSYDNSTQLYNLKEDIGEQSNIVKEHPDITKRLLQKMEDFDANLSKNARPVGQAK